jgi:hypothetical protein
MRKLLWGFVIVITASIIILACQKELSSPGEVSTKFDDKAAKEWYYGTFKKSPEWKNSSTKGKQLPDWKKGVYKKIGNFEIVEFPLVKQNRSVIMNANGSEQDKRRIAENTLDRIIFVKSNSGNISVRGIQFIPDIGYLANNNYDISKNTLGDIDSKFIGILSIRTWDDKEIVRNNFKDGKVTARSYPLSSAKISASSRIECNGVLITEWYSDCDIHITGSQGDLLITVDCTPWAQTGNSWCFPDPDAAPPECSNPNSQECFCELIGGCDDPIPNPDPDPDCNMSDTEAEDKLQSVTSEIFTNGTASSGGDTGPDPDGHIKKPVTVQLHEIKYNYWGSYSSTYTLTFTGVIFKHINNPTWKWESIQYNGIPNTSGSEPPCFSTSVTAAVAGPVISTDKTQASFISIVTANLAITCLFGIKTKSMNDNINGIYLAGDPVTIY